MDQVIRAIERGHTAHMAGQLLGCTGEAIRGYAKRYKSVAMALKAERKNLRDVSQNSLLAAILRGEGWAVMGVFKLFDEDGNAIPQNKMDVEHSGEVSLLVKLDR